jgi:hypothetical protein
MPWRRRMELVIIYGSTTFQGLIDPVYLRLFAHSLDKK